MKLPYFLAKRFVAGETFEAAVPKIMELNNKGIKTTLDLLGEQVTERKSADQALQDYRIVLKKIEEQRLRSNISVKLSMMGLNINKDYCRDNLFALLDTARETDNFVRIDMEGSVLTQPILDLFKEAYKIYGRHVGIVIQAYLHRSKDDIARLAEMGADVRLCKGAYHEPERVALQHMPAIRDAFKEYAAILLQKTTFPRIATHDEELVEWVKNYAAANKIGKARYEFQMLYGLRQNTCEDLAAQGYNVRIYVPFGTRWLPYFTRRIKERKENVWFILSTMLKR
ncbi:MAG: proline dehydrogenase family protein [Balneolales bacterium]